MTLHDYLSAIDPEILTIDNFDAAFIGVASVCGKPPVAAYDYDLLVKVLVEAGSLEEEAREYVDFNIVGAYVGERTPVIVTRPGDFEDFEITSSD